MINLITADDVHQISVASANPHEYTAEASDLGWRPGYFPEAIHTTIGNGQDFRKVNETEHYTKYLQANGCSTLMIFND